MAGGGGAGAIMTGGVLDDMLVRHGEPLDEDEDDNGRWVRV